MFVCTKLFKLLLKALFLPNQQKLGAPNKLKGKLDYPPRTEFFVCMYRVWVIFANTVVTILLFSGWDYEVPGKDFISIGSSRVYFEV